jgi:hypothetical protein
MEDWLRQQAAPAYDAYRADPSRGLSLEKVRGSIGKRQPVMPYRCSVFRRPVLDTGLGCSSCVTPKKKSQGPDQVRADDFMGFRRALTPPGASPQHRHA